MFAARFSPLPLVALACTALAPLAAAQPTACQTAWTTFNPTAGPSGPVGGAICFHDGLLIMRGAFLSAGGVPISNRVAMWDGMTWTDISQGFSLDPLVNNSGSNQMVSAFGNVYAVGEVILPTNPVRRAPGLFWNGQTWQPTPRNGLSNGRSFFLFPSGGKLYARGVFGFPDANGNTLFSASQAVWDGVGNWQTVGPSSYDIPTGVGSIVEYQGDVFMAGTFQRVDHRVQNPQHIPVHNIARLVGNAWLDAGTGVNATANIIEFDGTLYAWGGFTASGDGVDPLPRFAWWNGASWLPVGANSTGEPGAGFSAAPFGVFLGDDSRGPALFFRLVGNATNIAPNYPPTVAANGLVRFDGVGFTAVPFSGQPGINGYTSGTLRHSEAAVYAAMNNVNLGSGGPGHLARLGRADEIDSDGDGLLDQWERPGGGLDVNCDGVVDLDLWALGASDQHKDLFVEIDAMAGQAPDLNTLELVRQAFDNAPVSNPDGYNGIRLHTGVVEGNLPVEHLPDGYAGLQRIKRTHFANADPTDPNYANIVEAKRRVFRYCLFAVTHGGGSACGLAEQSGNDFMVTLGHPDWASLHTGVDLRAAAFMHMLGHALGLRHGGAQHDGSLPHRFNYKPNYHSIMNFSWQFPGGGRPGWRLDYSRQALPTLDEFLLDEFSGIDGDPNSIALVGPPPCRQHPEDGPVDFSRDGSIQATPIPADINHLHAFDPPSPGDRLEGHFDWSALRLNLRSTSGYPANSSPETTEGTEMTFEIFQALRGCRPNCPADFNEDGNLDPDDLSDFVTCFFQEVEDPGTCPRADYNRDGGVNPDDLSDYITGFFEGCQ